jgi:hypothetical protein
LGPFLEKDAGNAIPDLESGNAHADCDDLPGTVGQRDAAGIASTVSVIILEHIEVASIQRRGSHANEYFVIASDRSRHFFQHNPISACCRLELELADRIQNLGAG